MDNLLQEKKVGYAIFFLNKLSSKVFSGRTPIIEITESAAVVYCNTVIASKNLEKRIYAIIPLSEITFPELSLAITCQINLYLDSERSLSEKVLEEIVNYLNEVTDEATFFELMTVSYPDLVKKSRGDLIDRRES